MKKFWGCAIVTGSVAATMLAGCPRTPATHTQVITAGQNQLGGKQLYFMPAATVDFYSRLVLPLEALQLVPDDTDEVTVPVDGAVEVPLPADSFIEFYGNIYESIFVGDNGTIGLGAPGSNVDLTAHFRTPQVSLLPGVGIDTQSIVSVDVANDSSYVAVTYENVTAGGEVATAQAVFYMGDGADNYGDIALNYPVLGEGVGGVFGLSNGQLMGANAAQVGAFLVDFENQAGADLATEFLTAAVS